MHELFKKIHQAHLLAIINFYAYTFLKHLEIQTFDKEKFNFK
jgi:hypothetical protein